MGVTGLWRLIEPSGKPVPVETLENKVLAVDISIWLHQVVKGYQDAKGAPLPNAHLIGLFQRLCKLLYFRIKPVFVFDGGFPDLKKETIAKRQDSKSKYHSESEKLKRELALILSKKTAIGGLLGKQLSPKKAPKEQNDDDLFKLPAMPEKEAESESESEDESSTSGSSVIDLHTVDLESDKFKNMPINEKYEMLIELKETRKMNSWGRINELPKKSDNFSNYQMQRLLKRRKLQECLVETEKEMGSTGMSLNALESLLNEEGIDTKIESLPTRRIASSDTARYLLISNVQEAINNAKKKELIAAEAKDRKINAKTDIDKEKDENGVTVKVNQIKKDELDEDLERAIKMSLECIDEGASTSKKDESWCTIDSDSDNYVTDEDYEENEVADAAQAKAYLIQNTDFTENMIKEIIQPRKIAPEKPKSKTDILNDILAELNKEKAMMIEKLEKDEGAISYKVENNDEPIVLDSSTDNAEDSVAFISNIIDPVVNLDSSTDESFTDIPLNAIEGMKRLNQKAPKSPEESSSSDDDFIEVGEDKFKKPVVQVVLNVKDAPEDDIFADVFSDIPNATPSNIVKSNDTTEDTNSDSENEMQIVKEDVKPVKETKQEKQIDEPQKLQEVKIPDKIKTIEESKSTYSRITVKSIPETPVETRAKEVNQHDKEELKTNENTPEPKAQTLKEPIIEPQKEPLNIEQLNTIAEELQNEEQDLIKEKGRLDRVGRNITEQMTKEAQELLQIFGIPYIVAPMEAEAQCAFLESANLTDGTITDDSDIWLFGGRTVYKNFFNQKKHVLQFLSERIEKSFNLSREQLILLAMLVGSDYTTGVTGVGPVTALEILASFPYSKTQLNNETPKQTKYTVLVDGLKEFKKWLRSGKRTDDTSLKKKLKNVIVTDDFPSVRVVQAYLEPNVEKSRDRFSWGEMDITILRDYTKAKFGWSQNKLDEIIKPVLKRLQDRNTQKTIQNYFNRKVEFQSLEDQMSKRVKAAVNKMDPNAPPETSEEQPKKVRKRKLNSKKVATDLAAIEGVIKEDNHETVTTVSKRKKILKELPTTVLKIATIDSKETKSPVNVNVTKTERYQEIIPQRERDRQNLLQNKLKAIEVFRKSKIDPKLQNKKRKALVPKDDAELSESDSD